MLTHDTCQHSLLKVFFISVPLNDLKSLFVLTRWTVAQSLPRQRVTFFHSW